MSDDQNKDTPTEGKPQNKFLSALGGAVKRADTKVKEIDGKFHVSDKIKQATETVVTKTKELDSKLKISETTKKAAGAVEGKFKETAEKLKKGKDNKDSEAADADAELDAGTSEKK